MLNKLQDSSTVKLKTGEEKSGSEKTWVYRKVAMGVVLCGWVGG